MKKKIFTIIATLLAIESLWASQETKLYTFDDNVSLETNWDVNISATTSGVSRCEITQSIHEGFVLKDGNYTIVTESGNVVCVTEISSDKKTAKLFCK